MYLCDKRVEGLANQIDLKHIKTPTGLKFLFSGLEALALN